MINIMIDEERMYAIIEEDIDNNIEDVADLIEVQYKFFKSSCKRLFLQFTDCRHLNAAVSVIIGTLVVYANKEKEKSVKYRFVDQPNHPIFKFMKDVGMYKYFMKDEIDYTGIDVIPFNHIRDENMMQEYAERIMTLAPIKMQKEAQDILSSYIYEIYQNGLFHSQSPIGVFTSGYWNRNKKEFTFSIYDMGIGIPANVRKYLNCVDADSIKCLQISFIDGFTTSTKEDVNRGLGLTRLESFIRLNNGSMSIYSEDACCVIARQEKKVYKKLQAPIKGTLIIINIVADENHIYVIEKEKKE